jgi:hypothetical protein
VRRAPRSAPRPRTGEGAAKRGRGKRSGGGVARKPRATGLAPRGVGPNFWGPPGGDRNPTHKIFRIGLPKNTQKIFQKRRPGLRAAPPACAGHAVRMARAAGPDIGRRQAVAASLPMLRPCGPSIRPPRSPAGRSERASVETQRLVFACVHETPDSARLQAGIRGTRAFGGLPPRRLLSFHTSKPNRRVSRSPVHSGRSRPSRLWRGGSTTRTLRGIAASRHPARSSRLSDGRTAAASRIRDGRPKAAFTARPPDPGTVKHSDGCRNTDSQATAVTATHGPRPPRCAARVRGPCRPDGACRWGTAFGRRQAVAASLPNANAPAALPSVRHGHRLGAPNTHP